MNAAAVLAPDFSFHAAVLDGIAIARKFRRLRDFQLLDPEAADMSAQHLGAVEVPDPFGGGIEVAHVKIIIQNHDGVVSPLNRCQKYVRSFRYRPVHTHHLSPIPSGKPSRLGPDGSHQIGTISIGRMMLKSLFDRAACGR